MLGILIVAVIIMIAFQTWGFYLSQKLGRKTLADVWWGLGITLISLWALFADGFNSGQLWLVMLLTALWGLRLAWHIRPRLKESEDRRYAEMSRNWKDQALQTYLKVFLLQGGLMILMASSALSLSLDSSGSSLALTCIGVLFWLIGMGFETLGDNQLKDFKANPNNKGKLLTTGLWRYTRHPNYFGEVLLWWGVWLVALPNTFWWWSIITPITITVLILKVSGIPMAEAHYDQQDRADWKEYKARTSMFFPMPPR